MSKWPKLIFLKSSFWKWIGPGFIFSHVSHRFVQMLERWLYWWKKSNQTLTCFWRFKLRWVWADLQNVVKVWLCRSCWRNVWYSSHRITSLSFRASRVTPWTNCETELRKLFPEESLMSEPKTWRRWMSFLQSCRGSDWPGRRELLMKLLRLNVLDVKTQTRRQKTFCDWWLLHDWELTQWQ